MKVRKLQPDGLVAFSTLGVGDVFLCRVLGPCLKTDPFRGGTGESFLPNAVLLADGSLRMFQPGNQVLPLPDATVVY